MNDKEFEELAQANPDAQDPDFLAAVQENPERSTLLKELKALDARLQQSLQVNAPDLLKEKLLEIPQREAESTTVVTPGFWQWRRALPIAASLVLVTVLVLNFLPATVEQTFSQEIISHIYHHSPEFLNYDQHVELSEVNSYLEGMGGKFQEEVAQLDVGVAMDCWVAKENGLHMVVKGEVGPVTVMVIPNEPVSESFNISDERFEGIVSPTAGGNLIVVGEKEEAIDMYQNLLAANLNW